MKEQVILSKKNIKPISMKKRIILMIILFLVIEIKLFNKFKCKAVYKYRHLM